MALRKNTPILLIFISFFFVGAAGYSQSIIQGDDIHKDLEEAAVARANYWKDELSLTSKQTDLMEKKIVEFAIKKNKLLQSKMREEEKSERLKRLQVLENKDMRDILTKPQYERYILLLTNEIKEKSDQG